jgi:aspartyl-tRNA(Asn)/glutamyl-tRNA(Gln) amidotransferase subunit C
MILDKKQLDHLASLTRIELDPKEEKEILRDLEEILIHFRELEEVDTSSVSMAIEETSLKNILRDDGSRVLDNNMDILKDSFPEEKGGFLKTPPIFD